METKDLHLEREIEQIDYFASTCWQLRYFMLFQQLLEPEKPLINPGSNYRNLEIRRKFCWDDNVFWKIPEPTIIKTSLQSFDTVTEQTRHKPLQRTTANQACGKITTKGDASVRASVKIPQVTTSGPSSQPHPHR